MIRELKYVGLSLLVGFGLVSLSAAYWSIFQSDAILSREDNPRQVVAAQQLQRGTIFDRNAIVLAEGPQSDRRYPFPRVSGAIGYYDFKFGAAGVEASFNDILTGEFGQQEPFTEFENDLLHRPEIGYDLRTTVDVNLQEAVDDSLGEQVGAVVIVDVPSGQILAMVSHPTFDPNQVDRFLDENGEIPESLNDTPLFNRVRSGVYQPGSLIRLLLLGSLINTNVPLETPTPDATDPIDVSGLSLPIETLPCLIDPPANRELTLLDAFRYGCLQPFVQAYGTIITRDVYLGLLQNTGFLEAPTVYQLDTEILPPPNGFLNEATLNTAVGQGVLTVNPLQVARLMTAIANKGNAAPLHIADAYRTTHNSDWQPLPVPRRHPALLREETANQLKIALQTSDDTSDQLYGYVSNAYIGKGMLSWFAGFMEYENGQTVVVVTVIENTDKVEEARRVSIEAFDNVRQLMVR